MKFHIPTATKECRQAITVLTDIIEAAKFAQEAKRDLDPEVIKEIVSRLPLFYGMYLEGVCQLAEAFGREFGDIIETVPTDHLEDL